MYQMEEFVLYNQEISLFIVNTLENKALQAKEEIDDADIFSNEHVSEKLRKLIHIDDLRVAGSFFTGDELAKEAINLSNGITDKKIVCDPACGAGNLLLAATKHLSIYKTLTETLQQWGKTLYGLDLFKEFVESTKLRIIREVVSRGVIVDEKNLDRLLEFLPNIKVGSIFDNYSMLLNIDVLIINPPFGLIKKPDWCNWTTGKVNAAAIFIEFCLLYLKKNSNIVAILPDVLRSGTRYRKWRNVISSKVEFEIINNGLFDKDTDINTFSFNGIINENPKFQEWFDEKKNDDTLSNICEIKVGPVVPYRDLHEGSLHKFIHTKNIKPWETVNTSLITEVRLFKGRFITPPFVVVRRNSRPDDKYRAKASIIIGDHTVAVENHFIILEPFMKTVSECERILKILKDVSTDNFLNNRIRCRHLTVASLKDVPLKGDHIE